MSDLTGVDLAPRLAAVFAAAASFPDRVDSQYFIPVPGAEATDIEHRVTEWLDHAAHDDEALERILARRAANREPLGDGLRTVRLGHPRHLPAWADAFTTFLAAQPASSDQAAADGEATTLLASFERAAHALLPRCAGRIRSVEVDEQGYRGMVDALTRRLIDVCDPLFRFELQQLGSEVPPDRWLETSEIDGTRPGWMLRAEVFPGLAFVIGLACRQWQAGTVEMLERLRTDSDLIRRQMFGGEAFGSIVGFTGGAGDRHADGRSVTLLRFASGKGLVYKPKECRHIQATMDVIAFLNDAGLDLPLATREVLCKDGYGWEERVEAMPVAHPDGFARFYRRLGMLIRLFQLLGGRDLWADNLIAVGEQPHFVDLECVFYPLTDPPPLLTARRQALVDRLEATVVRTAIPIAACPPTPQCPTRDIGCLSHCGDPVEAGGGGLPIAPYRPWTEAGTADPWIYADDVSQGYRECHEVLVANQQRLLAEDGPLGGFRDVLVRFIWRSTWECYRILAASVHPMTLVDGIARETMLASVLRGAYSPAARLATRLDLPALAAAEVDAFRRLDVPLFRSVTTSTSLFTPDGTEIPNQFAATAWDVVMGRIASLHRVSVEADVTVLRAAIDAARGGDDVGAFTDGAGRVVAGPPRRQRRPDDVGPSADEVATAVQDIADLLCGARLPPLGTGCGWLGLLWAPAPDMWEVGPAAADLVSGALGPVLFLAENFSVNGDQGSWIASREALDELIELSLSEFGPLGEERYGHGGSVPGGLAGPGALLYVAGQAAVSLGDTDLLGAARTQVERASACAEGDDVGCDLAFGLAGLQLELLRLRSDDDKDDIGRDGLVSHLTDVLREAMLDPDTEMGAGPAARRLHHLVPSGRDGVALALARTLVMAPELVTDRHGAVAALAGHCFDLGSRGGRLAAVAGGFAVTAEHLPAADTSSVSTRELLLRVETCQLGLQTTADPEAALEAGRCLRVLLDRKAATGRWFPDRLVDDRLNLSALDGLPALGRALLRQLRPDLPVIGVLG